MYLYEDKKPPQVNLTDFLSEENNLEISELLVSVLR
mgnify:CR=1 FL=1